MLDCTYIYLKKENLIKDTNLHFRLTFFVQTFFQQTLSKIHIQMKLGFDNAFPKHM